MPLLLFINVHSTGYKQCHLTLQNEFSGYHLESNKHLLHLNVIRTLTILDLNNLINMLDLSEHTVSISHNDKDRDKNTITSDV